MYHPHLPVAYGDHLELDNVIIPLMTLIVALKGKDGIVLAGDKRSIYEDALHSYKDTTDKVFQLNDYVGMIASGDGDSVKPIVDEILSLKLTGDVVSVSRTVVDIAIKHQAQYFWGNNLILVNAGRLKPPNFALIVAGFTFAKEQKFFYFNTNTLKLIEMNDNYYPEGVTDIAKYILSREYKKGMSISKLKLLAQKVIRETSKQSWAVSKEPDILSLALPNKQ